jgi:hypothetical protein
MKRIEKTEIFKAPCSSRQGIVQSPKKLFRQGKNQESTTNKREIRVTVNGDPRSSQLPAIFCTELTKVGQRTLQRSLQGNRTQQPAAAHNQKTGIAVHKQSP